MQRTLRRRTHRHAGEADAIRRMATLVAAGATPHDLTRLVEHEVEAVLHLRECHFEPRPEPLPQDGLTIPVRTHGRTMGWMVCVPTDPAAGVPVIDAGRRRPLVDHLAAVVGGRRHGAHGS